MGCLFGYCGPPAEGLLDRMAHIMSHRCKNGTEKAQSKLNRNRIIEMGHGIAPWSKFSQVAADPRRDLTLGYSGVLFNDFLETGEFKSPAEQILSTMDESPDKLLTSLEGAFTAALAKEYDLFLIRDPSGVKTLYWTMHQERLLFASEIKALFADPSVPRKIRMAALPEYLTFSFIPGQPTMFQGVFELQPGTVLRYGSGDPSMRRYFIFEGLEEQGLNRRSHGEYIEQVRCDLERSVAECCTVNNGDPPGVFLSGGIDSSAVLAVTANRFPGRPIKTFSVHFGPRYANENQFISMMVERYRTEHTWLEIKPKQFIKRMGNIIWRLDDPIGDPITVPNFLLSETASKAVKVIVNGEGGDPCFGGPKNIPMILARMYGPMPGEPANGWMARNYLLSYKKCFSDLEQLLNPDLLRESGGEGALLDIISPFFNTRQPPTSFLNKLMTMNIRLKGANLILVKVDKMSSANGLLALPPLFSKRIIKISMHCPPGLKLSGHIEKNVLKKAVEDIVPLPIVQRPKSGMMVPVRFWFQGEMKRYARTLLSRKNIEEVGFFNYPYVKKLMDYDKKEVQSARHGLKLWMLVTFMLWHEQMIRQFPSAPPSPPRLNTKYTRN